MAWSLPRFYNESLPNSDRMNNPSNDEMLLAWRLLDVDELSDPAINDKFINTRLSIGIEYPLMLERVAPLVLDTVDLVETNRLDPHTSFIRMALSFQLAEHLSMWEEIRILGDMISLNYLEAMSVMHQESIMQPETFDYHSIYILLRSTLVNLPSAHASRRAALMDTKQRYQLEVYLFKDARLECKNIEPAIAEQSTKQFIESNGGAAMQGRDRIVQAKQSNTLVLNQCVLWYLEFEGLPPVAHSGVISSGQGNNYDDGRLHLFGYVLWKQSETLELEVSSEFHGKLGHQQRGDGGSSMDGKPSDLLVFQGQHKRTLRNTENDQTYIYTMDVSIVFKRE
ncbi:hypothetical protein SAMD00019534_064640 [Acytostelium subglobosum LB1]|uniref:hypothetical protein n=1 Tax=Acytostelium subglobosum LB1 TaxID=1410327 RepID=UPI0006449381|nr:hypothetical protein SAMD00019534_064640 [Acytostelium subglobosum LB1]GAM23289.1 hypothetical protein SAMD00019534_064640 [Acytostelium subglobosum LB1]|eukprot:XP_012753738.1 hypothetical protein SAMD00019534_064640 [Acytostelium subglobosum LB1]